MLFRNGSSRPGAVWLVLLLGGKGLLAGDPVWVSQWSGGGASNDLAFSVRQTLDGGWVLGGYSNSPTNSYKTGASFGKHDYWVVRMDAQRQKLWDKTFGGSEEDFLQALEVLGDGGFILGGWSLSGASGNKQSDTFGGRDYWIVRLDANGEILWQKAAGGVSGDYFVSLAVTPDGGFLLGGYSFSVASGVKTTPNYGLFDYWIVRMNSAGTILWDKTFGGEGNDYLARVELAANGGFAVAGSSYSEASGTKTAPNLGARDFWFLRLDTNGNQLSEHVFGSAGEDVLLCSAPISGGGYLLGGSSVSTPGDSKTAPVYGSNDCWVVRVDANGTKLWDNSYGGSGNDILWVARQLSDGRLVLGGWSDSPPSGTKNRFALGKSDYYLLRIEPTGALVWEAAFGGSDDEVLLSLAEGPAGLLMLGGYSASPSGPTKTAPHFGQPDWWALGVRETAQSGATLPHLETVAQTYESIQAAGFSVRLLGHTNQAYRLERSDDVQTWIAFATNLLVEPSAWIQDGDAAGRPNRAYRAAVFP